MRTFIIRARKGPTRWEQVKKEIGGKAHFEIIAHCIMNAFFVANGFRENVEVYIVLDSAADFPRSIKLSSDENLSLSGFHEAAVFGIIETALQNSQDLQKNETRKIAPGIAISGFGFEKLITSLAHRALYLLDRKGKAIDSIEIDDNPVFILSDHLALPKKNIQTLKRRGLNTISLGKKMLFASHCIVLLHYELDKISTNN